MISIVLVGSIAAELYTLRPLFPGSSEIDQMFKICAVMGTPSKVNAVGFKYLNRRSLFLFEKDDWPEGFMLAAKLTFRWPQCARTDLKKIIHSANGDGIELVTATLNWDPKQRPNALQVYSHYRFDLILLFYSINLVSEISIFQSQSGLHSCRRFECLVQ